MVTHVLEETPGVQVITIKYGFFDVFKFLSPFVTRHGPVRRILRELRDIRALIPTARISVIAHSFGTYGLIEALREPDISLHRVIFCGCIVPENFRRAPLRAQLGRDDILNDCGTHDLWPVLAKSITWGYGATGTFGFGTVGVHDRFNKFGHGDYFNEAFVREYWVPFLRDGQIRGTEWERKRTMPPYWMSFLAWLPLRWIILLLVILGCYWAFRPAAGEARATFGPQTRVGHYMGFPAVATWLEFANTTRHPVNFSNVRMFAVSPNGTRHPLEIEQITFGQNNRMQPFPRVYVAGEKIAWEYTFFRYDANFNALQQEINAVGNQLPPSYGPPDPARQVIPANLVEKARNEVERSFIWTPGRWILELEFLKDGQLRTVRRSFELDSGEIERMKRIVDYYPSGIGLFYAWAYLNVGGAEPFPTENLSEP